LSFSRGNGTPVFSLKKGERGMCFFYHFPHNFPSQLFLSFFFIFEIKEKVFSSPISMRIKDLSVSVQASTIYLYSTVSPLSASLQEFLGIHDF